MFKLGVMSYLSAPLSTYSLLVLLRQSCAANLVGLTRLLMKVAKSSFGSISVKFKSSSSAKPLTGRVCTASLMFSWALPEVPAPFTMVLVRRAVAVKVNLLPSS